MSPFQYCGDRLKIAISLLPHSGVAGHMPKRPSMSGGDYRSSGTTTQGPQNYQDSRVASFNLSFAIDVVLRCCEVKFEDERIGRLAKIHLDQRANQSV